MDDTGDVRVKVSMETEREGGGCLPRLVEQIASAKGSAGIGDLGGFLGHGGVGLEAHVSIQLMKKTNTIL